MLNPNIGVWLVLTECGHTHIVLHDGDNLDPILHALHDHAEQQTRTVEEDPTHAADSAHWTVRKAEKLGTVTAVTDFVQLTGRLARGLKTPELGLVDALPGTERIGDRSPSITPAPGGGLVENADPTDEGNVDPTNEGNTS